MKEQSLERYAKHKMEQQGALCLKLSVLHLAGFPDRLVLKRGGGVFFVEMKAPKGRLSELQKYWGRKLRALGFRVYVVAGKDELEEVMKIEFQSV